jgi:hypothetical protein
MAAGASPATPSASPLGSEAKRRLTPLALAIVFPQFHAIPENDQAWGANFTEWTLLRPMPRHVVDQVIYKPHPELGYYDLLDFEHRRFMRVLADQFGIHGFCYYHYWLKDHPGTAILPYMYSLFPIRGIDLCGNTELYFYTHIYILA